MCFCCKLCLWSLRSWFIRCEGNKLLHHFSIPPLFLNKEWEMLQIKQVILHQRSSIRQHIIIHHAAKRLDVLLQWKIGSYLSVCCGTAAAAALKLKPRDLLEVGAQSVPWFQVHILYIVITFYVWWVGGSSSSCNEGRQTLLAVWTSLAG